MIRHDDLWKSYFSKPPCALAQLYISKRTTEYGSFAESLQHKCSEIVMIELNFCGPCLLYSSK